MIDATATERSAMAAALRPLGDFVTEFGLARPLADYSREDILTLIEIVIDAYQAYLLEAHERQAERDEAYLEHLTSRRRNPQGGW